MLKSLRNKLVLLYTVSTGFFLVIIMIILLTITENKLEEKRLEAFGNHKVLVSLMKIKSIFLIVFIVRTHLEAIRSTLDWALA